MRGPVRLAALLFAVAALLLSGCGVPRPFVHGPDDAPPLARLATAAGVAVVPPERAPVAFAEAAAEALADGLRAAEVPAQAVTDAEAVAQGGYVVRGILGTSNVLLWELRSPEGVPLDLMRQPLGDEAPTAEQGRSLGAAAVAPLRAAIDADTEAPLIARMAAPPARPLPKTVEKQDTYGIAPRVAVGRIDGLPAARGRVLAAAVRAALEARDVVIAEDAPLVVAGHVEVGPPRDGAHDLRVQWSVFHTDGREAGTADQANTVPAALLAGRFPALAAAIAQGAAEGVLTVLRETTRP